MGTTQERVMAYEALREMSHDKPVATYIKGTLGKVVVKIIDPVSGEPAEVILEGDPQNPTDTAILNIWSEVEHKYFTRANKVLLSQGMIVPFNKELPKDESVNAISDDEMRKALDDRFFVIKNLIDKFTTPTPAERLLALANEMNKPVKTIQAIKVRLAELEAAEYEKPNVK